VAETKRLLGDLAVVLQGGLPRIVDHSGRTETKDVLKTKRENELSASMALSERPSLSAGAKLRSELATDQESKSGYAVSYRLTITDILRVLGDLRDAAGISSVFLLIDEFSGLSEDLQRRFTTLLRKLIGNHSGLFVTSRSRATGRRRWTKRQPRSRPSLRSRQR
jgi:hypothetical protein